MGPAEAVRTCLNKYATFSDRAPRPEYWWFALALLLAQIIAGLLDLALFGRSVEYDAPGAAAYELEGPSVIGAVLMLAAFLPGLAVTWRRLHDTGRSGLWALAPMAGALAALIPLSAIFAIGYGDPNRSHDATMVPLTILMAALTTLPSLLLLWWLASRGDAGDNAYGPAAAR